MPGKTLNDYLFEQLDRISTADSDSIDLEINKANSLIGLSDQILNVARLKMDIIQSELSYQFSEIDGMEQAKTPNVEEPQVELFDVNKENNWVVDNK